MVSIKPASFTPKRAPTVPDSVPLSPDDGVIPVLFGDSSTPLGGTELPSIESQANASGSRTARFSRAFFVSCGSVLVFAAGCCAGTGGGIGTITDNSESLALFTAVT